MEKLGYKVGQVNLLELNKEVRKDGDIVPSLLIQATDITPDIDEISDNTEIQMADAKDSMLKVLK